MNERTAKRPLYGLLLAGGKSRRMGRDKALLDRDGESLLSYAARLLEESTDRVYVSARAAQRDEPQRRRFAQIIDRYENLGPVAGILSAMDEHPQADWLVVACDLPNIDAQTFDALLQHRDTDKPFVAYRSSHDDLPEPLCALYLKGSEAIVRRFVDDGLHCPRKMLIRSDTLLLTQPNPKALDNVNTPEELRGVLGETA
ncbi:MAG: NTP transferase domain-containing protein [Gammaproteobacteria bacterium]|nr:NTP transferase domain-containing protein [Gammaproteobacteria bacterium]